MPRSTFFATYVQAKLTTDCGLRMYVLVMTCCGCNTPVLQALPLTQAKHLMTWPVVLCDIKEDMIISAAR